MGGGEGQASSWGGGQDGCERRSEVFVESQKKIFFFGGGAGGVQSDQGLGW